MCDMIVGFSSFNQLTRNNEKNMFYSTATASQHSLWALKHNKYINNKIIDSVLLFTLNNMFYCLLINEAQSGT